ncbi:MAG: DUF4160 domain-containing protein [Acidobacteriia bacterium]|nr:DUF4160 domain-containing protein [Terriglobia bacterium]
MPAIARIGPYRVFFFSNEGFEPPHVHIQRERSLAKFWLEPVALAGATGFPPRELRELERLVTENQQVWVEAWHEFFSHRDTPPSS